MRFLDSLIFAGTALAACNGHDELCSRKFSDVINIGTHDSAFAGDIDTNNQYVNITAQLAAGIRFLQAQTHNDSGTIEMCHTYCWERDAGPLTSYLSMITDFLDSNPNEVVTLLLTNQDSIPVSNYGAAFQTAGLGKYVYSPGSNLSKDQWPTLQTLINAGTRLVVFMDYHADTSQVSYILDEFSYYWETPYGITNSSFPTCSVDRPSGGNPSTLMGIMNHMLNSQIGSIVFPNQIDASTTNSLASIQAQYSLCQSQHSIGPNVVLLDWASVGDAAKAQLVLNGLS